MSVRCSHECLLRKVTNVSDVVQCVFNGNMAAVMMLLNWTTRGRMTKQLHGSTLKKDILTFTFVSRFKLFLKYRYFECYMLYLFDFVVWNCLFLLLLLLLFLFGIRELCMNDNQLHQPYQQPKILSQISIKNVQGLHNFVKMSNCFKFEMELNSPVPLWGFQSYRKTKYHLQLASTFWGEN